MFRSLALFCAAAVFALSTTTAQNAPVAEGEKVMKATPEALALFDESFRSMTQAEPALRAEGLFRLLSFAIRLEDKAPATRVVDALTVLVPTIEPEEFRNQLYEGIAHAFSDLGEYDKAVATLQRIAKPADRCVTQLNLAVILIHNLEQDKTLKPFDVSALLRQAIAGAVESKNLVAEAYSQSFLGHELARQAKAAESAAAFAAAIKTVKSIEEIREQIQVVQSIVQSQVQYGQLAGAQAAAQTIDMPEIKQAITGTFIQALMQHEKYAEAEQLIKTLPAEGAGRDTLTQHWIAANIKTVTDAKIGELSALISESSQERVLQAVVVNLMTINRDDVAVQVSKRLKDPSSAATMLFVGKIDSFMEEQKFAEAIRFIEESKEDEAIRQHLKRQVLMMQFQKTKEDAVAGQMEATFSNEEKIALMELRAEAGKAVNMEDMFEIMQEQFQNMDIVGAKQTLKLVAEQIEKETDPARIVDGRVLLAQIQIELQDKAGAKANLASLMRTLNVQDLKALSGLVPPEQQTEREAAVGADGRIRLELPGVAPAVNESAIRDQLFPIYVLSTRLLASADAPAESKATFEKAAALARSESVSERRAEKLLVLAQFLAEQN